MQKNSITNKITPCCGLPFSVIYWWVSNLTLNSEADRQYLLTQISQGGILSIDGWKVIINSGTLEADASLAKAEFLAWFDCARQPSCEQLKIIIEGFKVGNWTPADELPENVLEMIDLSVSEKFAEMQGTEKDYEYEVYNGKILKKFLGWKKLSDGSVSTFQETEIGKYFANSGFTADKDLAIDYKGQAGINGTNATANIPDYANVAFPLAHPSCFTQNGKLYQVKSGETLLSTDVVTNVVGTKLDVLGGLEIPIEYGGGQIIESSYNTSLITIVANQLVNSTGGLSSTSGWTYANLPFTENCTKIKLTGVKCRDTATPPGNTGYWRFVNNSNTLISFGTFTSNTDVMLDIPTGATKFQIDTKAPTDSASSHTTMVVTEFITSPEYVTKINGKKLTIANSSVSGVPTNQNLNTSDSVQFASLTTSNLKLIGIPTSPTNLQIGEMYLDISTGNIKVKQ